MPSTWMFFPDKNVKRGFTSDFSGSNDLAVKTVGPVGDVSS